VFSIDRRRKKKRSRQILVKSNVAVVKSCYMNSKSIHHSSLVFKEKYPSSDNLGFIITLNNVEQRLKHLHHTTMADSTVYSSMPVSEQFREYMVENDEKISALEQLVRDQQAVIEELRKRMVDLELRNRDAKRTNCKQYITADGTLFIDILFLRYSCIRFHRAHETPRSSSWGSKCCSCSGEKECSVIRFESSIREAQRARRARLHCTVRCFASAWKRVAAHRWCCSRRRRRRRATTLASRTGTPRYGP
jgi:hypothetical protein